MFSKDPVQIEDFMPDRSPETEPDPEAQYQALSNISSAFGAPPPGAAPTGAPQFRDPFLEAGPDEDEPYDDEDDED